MTVATSYPGQRVVGGQMVHQVGGDPVDLLAPDDQVGSLVPDRLRQAHGTTPRSRLGPGSRRPAGVLEMHSRDESVCLPDVRRISVPVVPVIN
jgi:hypothetical protein